MINDKRIKRKKTSSKKNTRNPQFNESLTFSIPKSSLCDINLEIEVSGNLDKFCIPLMYASRLFMNMEPLVWDVKFSAGWSYHCTNARTCGGTLSEKRSPKLDGIHSKNLNCVIVNNEI
jgi:hypothetical protein